MFDVHDARSFNAVLESERKVGRHLVPVGIARDPDLDPEELRQHLFRIAKPVITRRARKYEPHLVFALSRNEPCARRLAQQSYRRSDSRAHSDGLSQFQSLATRHGSSIGDGILGASAFRTSAAGLVTGPAR